MIFSYHLMVESSIEVLDTLMNFDASRTTKTTSLDLYGYFIGRNFDNIYIDNFFGVLE